jgi:hypothetical protein
MTAIIENTIEIARTPEAVFDYPSANSTEPVIRGSEPPDAGPSTSPIAKTPPAASEPTMAGTGDRPLLPITARPGPGSTPAAIYA